jgi:hypothetical protein
MALTIVTAPAQQNNTAEWNVTTSLVEDASHVNLRVRATIYGPAGTLGVIEQPKGSADFDFTEMLYKFINYKTPALSLANTLSQQLIPKSGSNLITDWTNDGVHPINGYVDQGDNSLKFINNASGYSDAHSNNFSVTKGKMYCLILKTGTITNTIEQCNQAGAGEGTYKPDKLSMAALPELGRYILFALETGTTCLRFGMNSWCEWNPAVFVELYLLDDCDWYLPYQTVWSEVYETAAGVTTVVEGTACLKEKTGQQLFKAPGISTFTDYICDNTTHKFLNPSMYLYPSVALSQRIIKTPPTGQESYSIWIAVLDRSVWENMNGYATYYDEGGGAVSTGTITPASSYQPIMALKIGNAAFTTTIFSARIYLKADTSRVSTYHYVYAITKKYERLIELIWLNQYGGFTSLCLSDSIREAFVTEKSESQTPSDKYIKRRLSKARNYWRIECEGSIDDPSAMDGIADIYISEYVMYSKVAGTGLEVFIPDKELLLHNNESLNRVALSFEYAD